MIPLILLFEVMPFMRFGQILLASTVLICSAIPSLAMTHARRGPTSPRLFSKRSPKPAARPAGQRAIESGRATEIQTALIKSGYLSGQASGHWDAETEAAMQKLQSDNGWQTKLIPDSRAIIKLGLGPEASAAGSTQTVSSSERNSTGGISQ